MSLSELFNNNNFNRAMLFRHKKQTSPSPSPDKDKDKESVLNKITQYTRLLSRNMETDTILHENKQSFNLHNSNCLRPNYILSTEPNYLVTYFDRETNRLKSSGSNSNYNSISNINTNTNSITHSHKMVVANARNRQERIENRINSIFKEMRISKYYYNTSKPKLSPNSKKHMKSQVEKLIEINRIILKPLRETNEMGGNNNNIQSYRNMMSNKDTDKEVELFSNEFNHKATPDIKPKQRLIPYSNHNRHSRNKTEFGLQSKYTLTSQNKTKKDSSNEGKTILNYKSYY